jgi:hypothetical protein
MSLERPEVDEAKRVDQLLLKEYNCGKARQAEGNGSRGAGGQWRYRVAAVHSLVLWAAPLSRGGRGMYVGVSRPPRIPDLVAASDFGGVAACLS